MKHNTDRFFYSALTQMLETSVSSVLSSAGGFDGSTLDTATPTDFPTSPVPAEVTPSAPVPPAPVGLSSDLPAGAGDDWPLRDICSGCGAEFSIEFRGPNGCGNCE